VEQRSKRTRRRRVLTGVTVVLIAILLAGAGTAFGLVNYLNKQLGQGIDIEQLSPFLQDRSAPEDPFWMLLAGTDWDEDGGDTYRTDVILLAHIDPGKKKAALISIPRDTRIYFDGYGYIKINAAYTYGELAADEGGSGPQYLIQAVTDLTGVEVSGYAQVDFSGLINIVDLLGGVYVDVPLDIIGDWQAGPVDVYAGEQVLDGQSALVFVRSRQYEIGDFQRQANQRTLLQAIARQVLSEDPITIGATVTQIAEMTRTNMDIYEIASLAMSLRGMHETDIYTYALPSYNDMFDEISYVVVDEYATRDLIASINAGIYPDYSNEYLQGEVSDRYLARERATDNMANVISTVDTSQYLIAVRNGYGLAGSATAVSDMLALAGYIQGEIGNTNTFVYQETLIIYRDDYDREAAEDIRARLGYGRIIPSLGRYLFEGNVLVVVGGDFAG